MGLLKFIIAIALHCASSLVWAQQSYHYYYIDGIASGDVSGPIAGNFAINLDNASFAGQQTLQDGTQTVWIQDVFSGGNPLVSWALTGDYSGLLYAESKVTRALHPDGSSSLTISTDKVYAQGGQGYQRLTLEYNDPGSGLFQTPYESLIFAERGQGVYSYFYQIFDSAPVYKNFSFQITATAVPEPSLTLLLIGGGALLGGIKAFRLRHLTRRP